MEDRKRIIIKSIASGSSGNCYLISDQKTNIIIEAGITFDRIQKGGDFKIHEFSACLLSHEH